MLKRILCSILIIALAYPVTAQILSRFAYCETFGMSEGLEHSVIMDMSVDKNGLLWIAVNGSLQLFDGQHFTNMNHLIHNAHESGYFGYDSGEDIFLLKQHILYKLTHAQYTSPDAPSIVLPAYAPENPNPRIVYEDKNFLYIAHPNDSLYQIKKTPYALHRTVAFYHKPSLNYPWSSVFIHENAESVVHYIDSDSLHCTFSLSTGQVQIDTLNVNMSRGALASGDTLIVLEKNTLAIVADGLKTHVDLPEPRLEFTGQQLMLEGRDSVYVSLNKGIYIFNLRTMTWMSKLQRTGGLALSEIKLRKMVKDKSGHLFVSTFNSGLIKAYPPNSGFLYTGPDDPNGAFIKCIRTSEEENLVLAGTLKDGLLVFDTTGVLKHQITQYGNAKELRLVTAILKITKSKYILVADDVLEITFHDGTYTINELNNLEPGQTSYYDSPIEDDVQHRYFVFNHRQISEFHPFPTGTVKRISYLYFKSSIAAAKCEGGFVIFWGDRLVFYDHDFTPYSKQLNIPNPGYAKSLIQYSPSQFLLAADQGLFLLDTLRPRTPQSRLYNHMVYSVLPGGQEKEFWFSTDFGLFRLNSDLSTQQYSIESGLQGNEFNTNSCYKSVSGKLYFGGTTGITSFYPEHITDREKLPKPYISLISINGEILERYIPPDRSPSYTLDYDKNVIQMRFLGLGQRSPKNYNYQYMVDGMHEKWVNLGKNTEIQFQLPSGRHTIYYHVSHEFDEQAQKVQAVHLVIRAPFYYRWWFLTLLILFFSGILFYILDLRRRRLALKIAHMQELDQKLQEDRLRISRDLHDNIGAQMATVKRGINFILDHSTELSPEQTHSKMKNLESVSTQINQELRDTIWAVRNDQIDVSNFITRLDNFVHQLAGPDSQYLISKTSSGNLNAVLGSFAALNLHRICQEAVNNIFKHAEASEITLSFVNTEKQLSISITDNGKGYDPNQINEGYGMDNMRNRAQQIGAEVSFSSQSGKGSSINVTYSHPSTSLKKSNRHA